jgi:hypothetical protein
VTGSGEAPTDEDRANVEAQLGRPARGDWRVGRRCHLGRPVVLLAAPLLEDGTPFPTLCWLACPLARRRVSRLEQRGRVRELSERLASDPALARAHAAADAAYAALRAERLPPGVDPALAARVRGGVGGNTGDGVKCLHAHDAWRRAGGPSPVGELFAAEVDPLDCASPCVVGGAWNPAWSEPPNAHSGPVAPPSEAPSGILGDPSAPPGRA